MRCTKSATSTTTMKTIEMQMPTAMYRRCSTPPVRSLSGTKTTIRHPDALGTNTAVTQRLELGGHAACEHLRCRQREVERVGKRH